MFRGRINSIFFVSVVAVLTFALALSGCGGGGGPTGGTPGGGDGRTELSLPEKWQRFADGNPTLELSESQALVLQNKVNRRVTHGFNGSFYFSNPDAVEWVRTGLEQSEPMETSREVLDSFPESVEAVSGMLEHNGVTMASAMAEGERVRASYDYYVLEHWLGFP